MQGKRGGGVLTSSDSSSSRGGKKNKKDRKDKKDKKDKKNKKDKKENDDDFVVNQQPQQNMGFQQQPVQMG
eukprot:CAMPEP_0116973376 /NCGR_PEP_ID=MMETSP0467-20121206/54456_1 /TAXON_ID=283647 /ORGANISM="Mesodinium pulex, Strain SPMC105" /LENGTH=70 /DNA_ID=CAMNT_0004665157 /DNA_START=269 /DNA_END=481 /DNA_ORIENTATION=+